MTVQEWLELARDAGLPWAESALRQMDSDAPISEAHSLALAMREFAYWDMTKEGGRFWAVVTGAEMENPHSEQDLRAMAEARKEAQ